MARDSDPDSFKVTDRRGRSEIPDAVPVESAPPAADQAAPAPPPGRVATDLRGLFIMFATSALVAMGESPDPLSGRVQKDLAQAGEAIDLLILLRTKTEGNRTPDEEEVLGQLLYDLQMRFVRATKRGPS